MPSVACSLRCRGRHIRAGEVQFKGSGTYGAGDETRTRDIFLGKEVLYQLSYARFPIN